MVGLTTAGCSLGMVVACWSCMGLSDLAGWPAGACSLPPADRPAPPRLGTVSSLPVSTTSEADVISDRAGLFADRASASSILRPRLLDLGVQFLDERFPDLMGVFFDDGFDLFPHPDNLLWPRHGHLHTFRFQGL